jgi:soluble lytic murein transglycosylase-like protein
MLRRIALAVVLAVIAAPASAQIYTWRDADGRLILSNKRPPATGAATVQSFAVPSTSEVRTTRALPSATRTRDYEDLIVEHAQRHGVRQSLVRAVIQVESAFNPYALSNKGAMGLMQLMPATAEQFGVRNAFNPAENVRAGVAYLRQLLDRYDNDEELALAAYNAGPGAVDRHGQSIPPYAETRNYVSKVNDIAGEDQPRAGTTFYKSVELIDGRPVVKYTDRKPVNR